MNVYKQLDAFRTRCDSNPALGIALGLLGGLILSKRLLPLLLYVPISAELKGVTRPHVAEEQRAPGDISIP